MASLDVAATLQNIRTAWANLTAWKSICGVSTAAEAAERIYIGGTDESEETIVPSTILIPQSLPLDNNATKLRGELSVRIWVEVAIPVEYCKSYETAYLWVWSQWSLMMASLEASSNQSGGLMLEGISTDQMPGRKDSLLNKGREEWGFSLNFTVKLI